MKKSVLVLLLLFIMSCRNKTDSNSSRTSEIKADLSKNIQEKKKKVSKATFVNYSKEALLLMGSITFFDKNLIPIGKLEMDKNSKIQILEKSIEFFNVEKSKDYCLKSNFLKITYKGKDYTVFGRDVYEIDNVGKFDFQNEKNEAFSIFPITNFEMGASDEVGLTGCDDFSYLIILDKKNNKYSTMVAPKNQENNSTIKFANLTHDDGSAEEIYNVKVSHDSLIVAIKVGYQEGYGCYILKSSFKDNFGNSIISERKRFYEESKYKELK